MTPFPEIGSVLPNMATKLPPLPPLNPIQRIQRAVCDVFDVSMIDLLSDRRSREHARPRQAAYLLCRQYTLASLSVIGREFGDRDHTTIVCGIKVAERLLQTNPAFAALYAMAERIVSNGKDAA